MAERLRTNWTYLAGLLAVLAVGSYSLSPGASQTPAAITIDRSQTYQTFHAWEGTVVLLGADEQSSRRNEIFDAIYRDIDLTRLRVEVFSGDENRTRSMQRFMAGEIDMDGWRSQRYATVNDDDDPFHINPDGFDFFDLDWRMEQSALPMMERAKARGERLEINLNYVAFTEQTGPDGRYIHTDPEEYAEFVLAAFLHLRDKYGVVPDYFEPLLEPDNSPQWDPVSLGRAISAAVRRLHHAGFQPRLILPSLENAGLTFRWLDGILQSPDIAPEIAEINYHRYGGASRKTLAAIAALADRVGTSTAMLEYWFGKATYPVLHEDLTVANVSAWQPRALYGFHNLAADGTWVLQEEMRFNRLYYMAIRPGDVRIGAQAHPPRLFDPVAFLKPDGRMSLVIKASGGGQANVSGLPPGTYVLEGAFENGDDSVEEATVGTDGQLTLKIPDAGVVSLRPAASP